MIHGKQLLWSGLLAAASILTALGAHVASVNRTHPHAPAATGAATMLGEPRLPYSEGQTELVTRSVVGPTATPIPPDAVGPPTAKPAPAAPPTAAIAAPAPEPRQVIELKVGPPRKPPERPVLIEREAPVPAPRIEMDTGTDAVGIRRLVGRGLEKRAERPVERGGIDRQHRQREVHPAAARGAGRGGGEARGGQEPRSGDVRGGGR